MMALALASTPAMLAQEAADTTFVFKDIKVNPTTSVKDQNKSGTCWSFSGVSFLEDELLKNGKGEFDLSEMYIARQCYIDKAIHYVRYCGATNFGQGGSILDVPYVYDAYGMVPEEVYAGLNYGEEKHNHGELAAVLEAYLKEIVKIQMRNYRKRGSTDISEFWTLTLEKRLRNLCTRARNTLHAHSPICSV